MHGGLIAMMTIGDVDGHGAERLMPGPDDIRLQHRPRLVKNSLAISRVQVRIATRCHVPYLRSRPARVLIQPPDRAEIGTARAHELQPILLGPSECSLVGTNHATLPRLKPQRSHD